MKRFAIALVVTTAALAALVACFELYLRAAEFGSPAWTRPDAQLGWVLRPGVRGWFAKEGRSFSEVNSAGQRDREHALAKPAGTYRIAVLGDAYSEGMHVPLVSTYWAQLPALLEACRFAGGRRVEALNFGVTGYGPSQYYLVLENKALRYQPDLVLVQFSHGNDVRDSLLELDPVRERPFFRVDADGGLHLDDSFTALPQFRKRASFAYDSLRNASDYLRVLQWVRDSREMALISRANAQSSNEAGLELDVIGEPRNAQWRAAWRAAEAMLARIGETARRNGAETAVFTVPFALQAHPDGARREALQAKYAVRDFAYPDRRVAEFARKHGMRGLVLADDMQAQATATQTYLYGFANLEIGNGHWNEHGHRAAAQIIARQLCERPA